MWLGASVCSVVGCYWVGMSPDGQEAKHMWGVAVGWFILRFFCTFESWMAEEVLTTLAMVLALSPVGVNPQL